MTYENRCLALNAPKVHVGQLSLTNVTSKQLIDLATGAWRLVNDQPITILAGHVSALNAETNTRFVEAFNTATLSYADGISLVLAGRLWTCEAQRMATTDLAPALMRAMQRTKSSPLRVAVVGGERGVAIRAASSLKSDLMEIVLTADGYPDDWLGQFKMIRESHPDVLILGLGMPLEALTLQRYANELPACVIITCGGWLRLLAGLEKRSPVVMQELRLEWLWRLFTDPRRTWRRYVLGGWHITRIALDRYDGA